MAFIYMYTGITPLRRYGSSSLAVKPEGYIRHCFDESEDAALCFLVLPSTSGLYLQRPFHTFPDRVGFLRGGKDQGVATIICCTCTSVGGLRHDSKRA